MLLFFPPHSYLTSASKLQKYRASKWDIAGKNHKKATERKIRNSPLNNITASHVTWPALFLILLSSSVLFLFHFMQKWRVGTFNLSEGRDRSKPHVGTESLSIRMWCSIFTGNTERPRKRVRIGSVVGSHAAWWRSSQLAWMLFFVNWQAECSCGLLNSSCWYQHGLYRQ